MTARDKRVEKAQTRVIFTTPFFAPGVAKLPVVFDDRVETACTDGVRIVWGTEFFDGLTDHQVVTVMVHETAHCLLGHSWRAPEGVDWEQWNIACDHAVNLMLKDFSGEVTKRGLADPFPFPEPADAYCADPRFRGMAEEAIYKALGSRKKGQSGGNPQAGSMPSFGQISKPELGKGSPGKLKSDWANTLIQSAKLAQGQGALPGSLARLVDETIHPRVPWWEILRSWLREQAADDWDFLHPDPVYEGSGFLMPSLHSERCGPIVFATDTSGSIDQTMLARFQAEKQNCLDTMRPRSLLDIYCDDRIQAVYSYSPGADIAKTCPCGGGTDFRPVFSHLESLTEPVKAVVYLTDLYGTFPDGDPGAPIIWVTWTKDGKAPFGEVVYGGQD
jgi:predicted metal-dependent peptidase